MLRFAAPRLWQNKQTQPDANVIASLACPEFIEELNHDLIFRKINVWK